MWTEHKRYFKPYLALVNFEVSIMPSWVVEEWNGRESNHFYSTCQVAWGFFFNKFSKQTLLSSSFDSLRSLNVYMSLPRHLTCLFFILLLVMAICGAQGRVWKIRHTCITFIAKSKTGSKEKNKSYNQIKMCTCTDCGGWDGNSFCMISLPI